MANQEKFSTPENISKENGTQEIEEGLNVLEESKNNNEEKDKLDEAIEKNLVNTHDFFDKEGANAVYEIYDCYAKAMARRDREPLSEESFFHHFFDGGSSDETYMFGDKEKGYLLGVLNNRVFIPTHFAPKTLRGGYDLLGNLGSGELPAALAITKDLAKTLEKMPEWKIEDFQVPASFRGEETKKSIAHNRHPQVRKLMVSMLAEYSGNSEKEISEELEKMGK